MTKELLLEKVETDAKLMALFFDPPALNIDDRDGLYFKIQERCRENKKQLFELVKKEFE